MELTSVIVWQLGIVGRRFLFLHERENESCLLQGNMDNKRLLRN